MNPEVGFNQFPQHSEQNHAEAEPQTEQRQAELESGTVSQERTDGSSKAEIAGSITTQYDLSSATRETPLQTLLVFGPDTAIPVLIKNGMVEFPEDAPGSVVNGRFLVYRQDDIPIIVGHIVSAEGKETMTEVSVVPFHSALKIARGQHSGRPDWFVFE